MKDEKKTKKQLLEELAALRRECAGLKKLKKRPDPLPEQESNFRALAENANDGMLISTSGGFYVYANRRATKITGYSLPELLKMSIGDLTHPAEVKRVRERHRKRLAGKKAPRQYETVIIRKDGQSVPIELTAARTTWHGQPAGLAIIRDISRRKQEERMRAAALRERASIADAMGDALIMFGMDGSVLDVNPSYEKITGLKKAQVVGKAGADIAAKTVLPSELQKVLKALKTAVGGKIIPPVQTVMVDQNGKETPVYFTSSFVRGENGTATSIIAIIKDISELLKTEEALKESEAQYHITVDSLTDPLHVIDAELKITLINSAFKTWCRRLGLSTDTIGWPIFKIFPFLPAKVRSEYRQVFKTGKVLTTEETTRIGGREFITDTRKIPIFEKGKVVRVATLVRDITQRKRTEAELKRYRSRLEEMVAERTAKLKKNEEDIKEQKDLLDEVFTGVQEGIGIVDEKENILFCNPAFANIFEQDTYRLVGRSLFELFPPEAAKTLKEETRKRRKGAFSVYELPLITVKGNRKHLLVTASPRYGKGGIYRGAFGAILDITQRKKDEKELSESKERLQIIFDFAPEAYYLTDIRGRFVDGNRSAEEISGYGREELIGKTIVESKLLIDDDIPRAVALLEQNAHGKPTGPVEFIIRRKDGAYLSIEISSYPVTIKDQTLILNIARDITNRKQTEEQLRASEELFRNTFEQAAVGMTHVSLDGHFIRINQKFCDIVGYSKAELLQRRLQDITHPEDIKQNLKLHRQLQNGELSFFTMEKRYICKEGLPVWVNVSVALVRDEIGEPDYFISVIEDIGDRKWAEEELARSEELHKILFEFAPEGYCLTDIAGRLINCNQAAEELTGYAGSELRGEKWLRFFSGKDRKRAAAILAECAKGRSIGRQELTLTRRDAARIIVEISAFPVDIRGQTFILHIARDITQRKQSEEKLRQSEQTARALMNATSDSAILADTHGNIMALNEAAAQRFGKPVEALIGARGTDIIPPEVASYRLNRLKEVVRTGKSVRFEDERDGMIFDTTMYPICDVQGNVSRMAVFGRDITEEKRTQEALKSSEQKYRELMELLPQTVFELDLKGNIITTNRAGLEAFGYTQQAIDKGLNVAQLYSPADRKRILQNIEKKMRGVPFEDHEYVALRKDGSTFPVIIFSSPILRDGKPFGIRGIVVDITERKRAEDALCRSEQTIRTFLNANDDPAALIEPKGTVLAVNTALAERLQESESGLLGKDIFKLFPPEAARLRRARAAEAVRSKKPVRFDDQSRPGVVYDTSVYPILSPGGQVDRVAIFTRNITERKHMEEALGESEEKFRNLAENMVDAIYLTDRDGRVTYISPAAHEIIGYRPEECVGKLFHAFVKRSDIPRAILDFSATIKGTPSRALQLDLQRKDKTVVSIELSATPVICNGRVVGTQGVIRDISDRLHAIAELEESEEKYRKIVELAPDGIVATDQEGLVTSCNTAFLRQFGLSGDHIVGKHFLELPVMTPKRRATYQRMFDAIMSGKAPQSFEIEWSDTKGNIRNIEIHVSLKRRGRKKIGLQAILRDITARKRAEEALRESEEKHRNLIELAPDAIITFDRKGFITSCNQAALKMAGVAHEKHLIGKHFAKLAYVSKADLPRFRKFFDAAIRGKKIPPVEYAVSLKDGTLRWSEGIYTLLRKEGKVVGIQAIIRNITERKREERIQRTLYRISNAVHTTGDLQELYGEIYKELNVLLKTKNFSISLYDKKRNLFSVQYHVDERDRFEGEVSAGKSLTAYMIKGKKPLLLTAKQIQALKRAGKVKPIGSPVQIWLGVPLKLRGRIIGSLVLCDYHNEAAFDERDLQMLEFISNQVAISIDHKRFEDSLRESEDLFRNLADRSPHMIFVNARGTIAYANNKCVRVSGYTRKELYSRDFDFLTLVAPPSRKQVKRNFALHREGKRVAPYRCIMKTKAGKHIEVLISTLMIQFAGQSAVLGIVTGLSGQADVF